MFQNLHNKSLRKRVQNEFVFVVPHKSNNNIAIERIATRNNYPIFKWNGVIERTRSKIETSSDQIFFYQVIWHWNLCPVFLNANCCNKLTTELKIFVYARDRAQISFFMNSIECPPETLKRFQNKLLFISNIAVSETGQIPFLWALVTSVHQDRKSVV